MVQISQLRQLGRVELAIVDALIAHHELGDRLVGLGACVVEPVNQRDAATNSGRLSQAGVHERRLRLRIQRARLDGVELRLTEHELVCDLSIVIARKLIALAEQPPAARHAG